MRLAITIFAIRLMFLTCVVAFLVTLPLSWLLDTIDEDAKRFPRLRSALDHIEFVIKNLGLLEARAHNREVTRLEAQIAKEFES